MSRGVTADPVDIYISHANLFGEHLYRVMIDGVKFDMFMTSTPLTNNQMIDVQAGYREALTGYRSPC